MLIFSCFDENFKGVLKPDIVLFELVLHELIVYFSTLAPFQ